MYRTTHLFMALLLVAWAAGCKKKDASPDVQEADDIAPAAAEKEAAGGPSSDTAAKESASPESAASESALPPPQESAAKTEDMFTVKLTTTKGDIIIDVHRNWAPLGAERFHELVTSGFYDNTAFFRVVKGFMAQAGLSGTPKLNTKWAAKPIRDDKVVGSNTRGMVTFAMAGADTRTTQFFINLVDNKSLDAMGFAPFGQVRDMTAAEALYSGYGDGPPAGKGPNQNQIRQQGNKYLKKKFPELDYILSATLIEE